MSEQLSAEEREALRTSGSWPNVGTDLFAAVERLLTARLASRDARLAAVEALAQARSAHAQVELQPQPRTAVAEPNPKEKPMSEATRSIVRPDVSYPWPADLGPMPVQDEEGRLVYVEPPRQRICDDDALVAYYLERGMYDHAGTMLAARHGLALRS